MPKKKRGRPKGSKTKKKTSKKTTKRIGNNKGQYKQLISRKNLPRRIVTIDNKEPYTDVRIRLTPSKKRVK